MDYSIRQEGDHLVVEMSGSPSVEDTRRMFVELKKQGGTRALLVVGTRGCLNLPDTMDAVSALPQLGFPADYRVALLTTDESMRTTGEFAENVAVNRGIPLHSFSNRDAALRWLSRP
jgi:hypothetical protein